VLILSNGESPSPPSTSSPQQPTAKERSTIRQRPAPTPKPAPGKATLRKKKEVLFVPNISLLEESENEASTVEGHDGVEPSTNNIDNSIEPFKSLLRYHSQISKSDLHSHVISATFSTLSDKEPRPTPPPQSSKPKLVQPVNYKLFRLRSLPSINSKLSNNIENIEISLETSIRFVSQIFQQQNIIIG